MKSGHTILLAAAATFCWGESAHSAAIMTIAGKDGRVIQLMGRIEYGDADAFIAIVKQATAAGKRVERVQLNSTGGRLVEGARIAAVIKDGKIPTAVGRGSICASACFLAFAAGHPKYAAPGAFIGVHKASENGGRETTRSSAATHLMARFARDLGVPSWIIDRMVTTPAKQIAWLSAEDLRAMGVNIAEKPPAATAASGVVQQVPLQHVPRESTLAVVTPKADVPARRQPWNEFIEQTIALSAEQHQGHAALVRACKPDSKECAMQVEYSLKDGTKALATVFQNSHGDITRREVCVINAADSIRDCTNWDTGAKYRDVRNSEGNWVQAVQQH